MHFDESVNYTELKKQVNRLVECGVHGLFCIGTNGEFYTLTFEEKRRVIKTVVAEANRRIPVIANIGCVTTKESIELAQSASEAGVDVLSVVTPYFASINERQMITHFTAVASCVYIPVMLYNIPARTGNNISASCVEQLAKVRNITCIKDSSGVFDNLLKYMEVTPDDFVVLQGNDGLIFYSLMAGADGQVSGFANIFPNKIIEIYEKFKQGKIEEAKAVQRQLRPLRDFLGKVNVKRIANLVGHNLGPSRAPFDSGDEHDQEIQDLLNMYYQDWS